MPVTNAQVGPRLELEVVKVEEGLCDGKVLFHSYVKKSAGEASQQQSAKESERAIKEKRRKQQVCLDYTAPPRPPHPNPPPHTKNSALMST